MGFVETAAAKFKSVISPELFRSRSFWAAVSGLAKSPIGRPGSPAEAAALRHAVQATRDAFLARGPVAWASLLLPSELILGAGANAFYPEIAAAVIATAGLAERFLERAAADGFSADLCSFHRVILGASSEGFLPRPDFLVSTSCPCDSAPLSFSCLAGLYGAEYLAVDVPMNDPLAADTDLLAVQLEEIFARVSGPVGGGMDGMRTAIELSNEAGQYARQVEELRRGTPCPMSGWDALGQLAVVYSMPGTKACVDFYRRLASELGDGSNSRAPANQEHRLLWMHIKPYFPTDLPDLLEEKGAVIVAEEYSRWFWQEMDPDRPFESLARKILSHPSVGPAARRAESMVRLARDYRVDGAVHFSHRGCRQSGGCARQVRDELTAAGIRTLILDGECLDSREHNEGQTRTRLEAFLESLHADGAGGRDDGSRRGAA